MITSWALLLKYIIASCIPLFGDHMMIAEEIKLRNYSEKFTVCWCGHGVPFPVSQYNLRLLRKRPQV